MRGGTFLQADERHQRLADGAEHVGAEGDARVVAAELGLSDESVRLKQRVHERVRPASSARLSRLALGMCDLKLSLARLHRASTPGPWQGSRAFLIWAL